MKKVFDFSKFNGIKTADFKLEKNEGEESYKLIVIADDEEVICFNHVPSQYIKEDQIEEKDKGKLDEEKSRDLVKHRINTLLTLIRQCIFTSSLYGIKLNGNLESYDKDENEK